MQNIIEELPLFRKIMWAVGQFGWSLTAFAVGNLAVYFFMPPETGESTGIPGLIYQGAVIGVMTVIGLANFGGRIFDAVTDPWIAGLSDRSTNKLGRRRFFLLISSLPFAILSMMVFFPPDSGPSTLNSAWVVASIILFYLFMTMYTIPHGALMPELGHTSKERLLLSTIGSLAWAMGFFVGQATWIIKDTFQGAGMAPLDAFRVTIVIFAGIGFISMLMPVIFIDEKRYCRQHVSKEGTMESLIKAFQNRDFFIFIVSDFCYFVSNTFLEIGIVYYVTILMGLPEVLTFTFMAVMFILSFVFYPFIVKIANRVGKKRILVWAFVIQVGIYIALGLSGLVPGIPIKVWGWAIILIEAVPVAIFGIIPGAIVADIARADGIRTGNYKEAIFMGARNFVMKLGIAATNVLFPSLLILGRSVENPLGVRMTAVVALGFTIVGTILLTKYSEGTINALLAREEEDTAGELKRK